LSARQYVRAGAFPPLIPLAATVVYCHGVDPAMDTSSSNLLLETNEPPERLVLDPRATLLLDVDGTLLDMAPAPELVVVPTGLTDLLGRLYDHLTGALALVSGRPIADLDLLFAPLILPAAGEHGAEVRHDPDQPIVALAARPEALASVHSRLTVAVADVPGVHIERKRTGFAIHYRQAAHMAAELHRLVDDAVAEHAADIHVQPGKMVLEIKGRGCSKAHGVAALMEEPPFAGRRPLLIGDDATDRDAFAAVRQLGGHCISVGADNADIADWVFATPSAVRAWLSRIAPGEAGR
jgi:trehalose 6-phosphate phosphatase